MRTAVVLGAGGHTGQAFHLGVLTALQEVTGFDARRADVVVGTSAGSLVAAGLAAGLSAQDMAAGLTGDPLSPEGRALREASRAHQDAPAPAQPEPRRGPLAPVALLAAARRPWAVRPGAVASGLMPAGRESTERIRKRIARLHPHGWPRSDVRICAVRVKDARRVVFGTPGAPQVDLAVAVAASCAIPSWFAPVHLDGDAYVDGGVHSPTNADVVASDALDLVMILSPMTTGADRVRPRVDAGFRIAVRRYLAAEVHRLRGSGAEVVVVQPTPDDLAVMGPNPMRRTGGGEVVRTAAESMRARLRSTPSLERTLSGVGPGDGCPG